MSRHVATAPITSPKTLDALGEFVKLNKNLYLDIKTWQAYFNSRNGRTIFSHSLQHLRHKAKPLLQHYKKHGMPVLISSTPWPFHKKDAAIQRGNHPSASAFAQFLREEMGEMCSKGMFIVVPCDEVGSLPQLRLLPIGCVPQRDCCPWIIIDYAFSSVNTDTLKMAPLESMQWGQTLNRLLWYIHTADRRQGIVFLSKTDLSDRFY